MPQHYRAILFDFGNTLAPLDYRNQVMRYGKLLRSHGFGIDAESLLAATQHIWETLNSTSDYAVLEHVEFSRTRETYDLWRKTMEKRILAEVGIPSPPEELLNDALWLQDDPSQFALYPDVVLTLEQLCAEGYKLGVLSNFVWSLPDILASLRIAHYFSSIQVSARTGYLKPHHRAFELAFESLGVVPENVIHIGDSEVADFNAAQKAGAKAILLDRTRGHVTADCTVSDLNSIFRFLQGTG